jgi:hypothetical protein
MFLLDQTTGHRRWGTGPSNWQAGFQGPLIEKFSRCAYGSCSGTGVGGSVGFTMIQSAPFTLNASGLTSTNQYEIGFNIWVVLEAGESGDMAMVSGGQANADLNLGTHGNGAQLTSITIS